MNDCICMKPNGTCLFPDDCACNECHKPQPEVKRQAEDLVRRIFAHVITKGGDGNPFQSIAG